MSNVDFTDAILEEYMFDKRSIKNYPYYMELIKIFKEKVRVNIDPLKNHLTRFN